MDPNMKIRRKDSYGRCGTEIQGPVAGIPEPPAEAAEREASYTSSVLSDADEDMMMVDEIELNDEDARRQEEEGYENMDEEDEEDEDEDETYIEHYGIEDHPYDTNFHRKLPRTRTRTVEAELDLTRSQSKQLRTCINEEMKKAGILGRMSSSPFSSSKAEARRQQHDATLRQIIQTAKHKLVFLRHTVVEEKRLDQWLLARMVIYSRKKKHDEFMTGTEEEVPSPSPSPPPSPTPPERPAPQSSSSVAYAGHDHDLRSVEADLAEGAFRGLRRGRRRERRRERRRGRERAHQSSSALAASFDNLHIEQPLDAALQNLNLMSHESPGTASADPPPPPASNAAMFDETAFLIRVVNSTTMPGIKVQIYELISSSSRRDSHPPLPEAIEDLSLENFTELLSAQVGFDVRGRISIVLPRGGLLMPAERRLRLTTEDQWRTVLWTVYIERERTVELVVERDG
ncbi:hypothetical protein N0V83_008859 [Neocucurbitaria cava]|uniref:Uncharacterized protein n=1 Tax=Neocucurbitaria cava TaxID=798079 RepID=A0A9W8Y292_9PLEO|nr:hypothetical protein N0V83_008859 [Neocucurbitaria cava]